MDSKITLSEYMDLTKVIRMLYGVNVATIFFEQNFKEFTGVDINTLSNLKKRAKLDTTSEEKLKG